MKPIDRNRNLLIWTLFALFVVLLAYLGYDPHILPRLFGQSLEPRVVTPPTAGSVLVENSYIADTGTWATEKMKITRNGQGRTAMHSTFVNQSDLANLRSGVSQFNFDGPAAQRQYLTGPRAGEKHFEPDGARMSGLGRLAYRLTHCAGSERRIKAGVVLYGPTAYPIGPDATGFEQRVNDSWCSPKWGGFVMERNVWTRADLDSEFLLTERREMRSSSDTADEALLVELLQP